MIVSCMDDNAMADFQAILLLQLGKQYSIRSFIDGCCSASEDHFVLVRFHTCEGHSDRTSFWIESIAEAVLSTTYDFLRHCFNKDGEDVALFNEDEFEGLTIYHDN